MATLTELGDGVRKVYRIPLQIGSATATVDGSPAAITSQNASSVTFTNAPADGKEVIITYTPAQPKETISADDVIVEGFTTAGSSVVSGGSVQTVIEAVADLADPL